MLSIIQRGPLENLPPQNKLFFMITSEIRSSEKKHVDCNLHIKITFWLNIKMGRMVHRNLFYNRDLQI